jgi:hypothetical protein
MMGGVENIFSDMTNRVNQFFFSVRMMFVRMRSMMYRVYGTIFAMIYMVLSGITAAQNLGDSTIGRFLDTFCFYPETPITKADGTTAHIGTLKVGDELAGNSHVTAVFTFDGMSQPMVRLDDIIVSTNHYVVGPDGNWIMAGDHDDAVPIGPATKPLVCLNTSDHKIRIGRFTFSDYDETEAADEATEKATEAALNGGLTTEQRQWTEYGSLLKPNLHVQTRHRGIIRVCDLTLGDELVGGGRIIGLVTKAYNEMTSAGISPSALVYIKNTWRRLGTILPVRNQSGTGIGVFVYPKSYITTASGLHVRDYIEVFSPTTEKAYTEALLAQSSLICAK